MTEERRFAKVAPLRGMLSAYSVTADGKQIGFVWKRKGFSYRGMQGWNRGIRLRDFHPIEWVWGERLGVSDGRLSTYSRQNAADRLRLALHGAGAG